MIETLIQCGITRKAAEQLLVNIGNAGLATVTGAELRAAGVPPRTAERVHAALVLSRQLRACEARNVANEPSVVADRVRPLIGHLQQEVFVVVCINIRNEILDVVEVARGTVHSVEVHPREIFRVAIRCAAAGIVLAHNHPSGDPTPSTEDIELTRRVRECGELMGIPVIDHVVVTERSHRSIFEWMGSSL